MNNIIYDEKHEKLKEKKETIIEGKEKKIKNININEISTKMRL